MLGWARFSDLSCSPVVLFTCPCNEKMLFLFSPVSDFIFGKIAPCQLLHLNFKNKSDFLTDHLLTSFKNF